MGDYMKRYFLSIIGMLACVATVSTAAVGEDCTSRWNKLQDNQPAHATDVTDYVFNCPNFTGNVGIGTTSPSARLSVGSGNQIALVDNPVGWASYGEVPNILITDTVNNPLSNGGWSYQQLALNQQNGQQVWSIGWMNGGLGFKVNNGASEPLFLAQSGNVGIGTTTPGSRLDVNGTITMGGATVLTSDRRLKTDIKSIPSGALTQIAALNPVTFRWKDPKDDGMQGIQMGLIAQDVERILPTAVLTAHDAFKTKSIKYNEVTAVLIKAVQEQQRQIATQMDQATAQQHQISMQQKQIAAMRADNAELRSRIGMLEAQRIARAQ
jgi:hypothetical protein